MNLAKCDALKTLGFKYITRNMNGDICAWKILPIRSLSVIRGYENDAIEKYKGSIINDIEDDMDDSYEYKDGYNVSYCWFIRGREDNAIDSMIHLDKNDRDFENITWENSPYML